jgi:hypothetical protein
MTALISHAEPAGLGRRIVRLFRPHRGALALISLTILTTSALSVISALLVRQVFDKALFAAGGPDLGALYPLVAALIAIPIVNGILNIVQVYLTEVIASRTADQRRWASCWSRSTDTNATRRRPVERRAHARKSEVFPLPGGAETTVTRLVTARSSVWSRSSRSSRPRATASSLEIDCRACSPRSGVALVVMRFVRSATSIRLRGPIRSLG